MTLNAIQDAYAPLFSHCFGCGSANPHGHRLRSYLKGSETVATFVPEAKYSSGIADNVYGGLIAALLDCHGTASAAAFCQRSERDNGAACPQLPRFVTASLNVNFKRPTPLGPELQLKGTLLSLVGRKALIGLELSANGEVCVAGEMLAIRLVNS
ncbi:PaaI family thioesterase [Pseudorhodoferax soli]|uniref:Thioesterase superfamily protein n=1 Tax=Pseudorhodoferax soli TaxID=545864 RepID=A0A368XKM9_9BURK|nr:hotdog domain-containing protein [Pseudorhodoferax soli]RCW68581.1 thioesterase superfamily protein [Pseudorhodoferax soli]